MDSERETIEGNWMSFKKEIIGTAAEQKRFGKKVKDN